MVTLEEECILTFSFPKVHRKAKLQIWFHRTLRIPDDGAAYPLPPGLGYFPLRHVDDHRRTVPEQWIEHGGVMLPMYQSEAMWLSFDSDYIESHDVEYPFAVKIATGKINAASGKTWRDGLHRRPQDYVVVPEQPWLDGYCVEKGFIRQFVAMPLGDGYTVEEQVTGKAEHGGLQIAVYPMKRDVFERRFPVSAYRRPPASMMSVEDLKMVYGLAPGGRMRQDIYKDPYTLQDWDQNSVSRCFVHIANSLVWKGITGEDQPTTPFAAKEYTNAGLPWFEYYDDKNTAIEGASILAGLSSVADMAKAKGHSALSENVSVTPENLVKLRKRRRVGQVREWT